MNREQRAVSGEQGAESQEVAIKVENVSKDFKLAHERSMTLKSHFVSLLKGRKNRTIETQHALKDISFEVKKGEFFGIVGRNGSGKSTMLKMLAGIYQPTKGKIQVNGKLVPFIELGVGFNPELTGRENVFLNGALLGFSEEEVAGFYDEVVDFAELEQFMDKKLKNYSSGMQVRLAFSMAIRAQADILLIDEVLAVGDADFQRKCFEYFKTLKKNQKTVVFVSHDMEAIREYCDSAILIEKSEVIYSGSSEKTAQEYTKLFNPNPGNAEVAAGHPDDELDRWGSRDVVIDSIVASVKSNYIEIRQKIVANKDIEGCIVGIRIRALSGEHVAGTNTKHERQKVQKLKKNETVEIIWKVPNILSTGKYLLDPAIVANDGISVYDWWDGASSFTISKDRVLPYYIDPGFELKILRK